jgi:ribonuclease HIII
MAQNSFTFPLTPEQQTRLVTELDQDKYEPTSVPHTIVSVKGDKINVNLYQSGKCLIQGRGAQDWITFILEPEILREVVTGDEQERNPENLTPHIGIDESGKGDFFGPLVVAAAYTDETSAKALLELGVRDSKRITSDAKMQRLGVEIRKILQGRFALVSIGPRAYNRLYAKIGNVNKLLAWGHARAIENLLEKVPDCTHAVADQFGPKHLIEKALLKGGRNIKLEQRHKAESDIAVAAASILARDGFLDGLQKLRETYDADIPKGASAAVRTIAENLVKARGPAVLLDSTKCHFKTAGQVLEATGFTREELPDPND